MPSILKKSFSSSTLEGWCRFPTVSNWGVYGVIGELSDLVGQNLFTCFKPPSIVSYLMSNGGLDGVTTEATPTENGFPMAVGDQITGQLGGLCLSIM